MLVAGLCDSAANVLAFPIKESSVVDGEHVGLATISASRSYEGPVLDPLIFVIEGWINWKRLFHGRYPHRTDKKIMFRSSRPVKRV